MTRVGIRLLALLLVTFCRQSGLAQNNNEVNQAELIRQLQEQVRRLEQRILVLESSQPARPADASVPAQSPVSAAVPPEAPAPRVNIQGYGDGRYRFRSSGTPGAFALGQLDLFVNSRLTDKLHLLTETVLEADDENVSKVELERLLLQFHPNRFFEVQLGRYHSRIGYFNEAFHHGAYFQTTVDRPQIFAFEDEGGVLPVHNVGLTVNGVVPSGSLGLRYFAEIGNGRSYQSEDVEPVQTVNDENGSKSVNFGLAAHPDGVAGLQLGGSFYRDKFLQDSLGVEQKISAAFVTLNRGRWELLNEVVWMKNRVPAAGAISAQETFAVGLYSLASYDLGLWRPYFRFENMNVAAADPVARVALDFTGRQRRYSGGVRVELNELAAVKLQLDRTEQVRRDPFHHVTIQMAFAF